MERTRKFNPSFLIGALVVIACLLYQRVRQIQEENAVLIESAESANSLGESTENPEGTYVAPYVTKNGKVVKGHVRKSYSSNPKALKQRNSSRYYNQTHKHTIKERRRKKD